MLNIQRIIPARWQVAAYLTLILWLIGGLFTFLLYVMASPRPTVLEPGVAAPLFALPDQCGHTHNLRDYKNGIALIFIPGTDADSIKQLRSLNASIGHFDAMGAKVFAVTSLPPLVTKPLHDREKLAFPILTDAGGKVGQQYRITLSDGTGRVSYVIAPDKKILLPVTEIQTAQHGTQMVAMMKCCLDVTPAAPSKNIGKPIADFILPRVTDNKPESLFGDKSQKATVVLFLSAHCPCSQGYDARNRALAEQYQKKGVRFVGINSASDEPVSEVAAHAQKVGFPFPVLKDAGNKIADRLEAQLTPEVFVLDSAGILRYHGRIDDDRDPAAVTENDLQNALDALLAGKRPAHSEQTAFGCAIVRTP